MGRYLSLLRHLSRQHPIFAILMRFLKESSPPHLAHIIKEFWIVENPETTPEQQKIIPDGYCEIVLHYGDSYRIKTRDAWEEQDKMLLTGQCRQFFFLENTGTSAMLGIKLMPVAAYALFHCEMSQLLDRVVPLNTITETPPPPALTQQGLDLQMRIELAVNWIEGFLAGARFHEVARIAAITDQIIAQQGMSDIESLAQQNGLTRRHLEREFKKMIGLSPKYFSRIIQFSYIFEAMRAWDNSWVDVALNSGYFDQSHFIRNFKAFTGESPSEYGFDQQNLANFFLRRD